VQMTTYIDSTKQYLPEDGQVKLKLYSYRAAQSSVRVKRHLTLTILYPATCLLTDRRVQ
jgi:hypothetical protein